MPPDASSKPAAGPSRRRARGPESRRYPRFPANLAVTCAERGGACRRWRGRTADVSGGGFAVELPVRLRRGTRLAITVRTGIGPMRLEAEVLWARSATGTPDAIRHGLQLPAGGESLDLPLTVLLGEWLRLLAAREGRARRRPAPAEKPKGSSGRSRASSPP